MAARLSGRRDGHPQGIIVSPSGVRSQEKLVAECWKICWIRAAMIQTKVVII
jgi:hypothetical protein